MKCKSTALLSLSMVIVVLFVVGEPFLPNVSGDCKTIENDFSDNIRAETSAGSYHQNLTIKLVADV